MQCTTPNWILNGKRTFLGKLRNLNKVQSSVNSGAAVVASKF